MQVNPSVLHGERAAGTVAGQIPRTGLAQSPPSRSCDQVPASQFHFSQPYAQVNPLLWQAAPSLGLASGQTLAATGDGGQGAPLRTHDPVTSQQTHPSAHGHGVLSSS